MGVIAVELGMTRNAVIGKVTRLREKGIVLMANPVGANMQRFKKWKPAAAKKAFGERCREINTKVFKVVTPNGAVRDVTANSRVGRIFASRKSPEFFPDMAAAVLALRDDQCRWPLEEDGAFAFCSCAHLDGGAYCPEHTQRSFACHEVRRVEVQP